jgi:hypothetical protein
VQSAECKAQNEGINRRLLHISSFLLCMLTFGLLPGCSSTAIVTVKPVAQHDLMTVNFPRACYEKDQSGQDQIVLQSSPIDEPSNAGPGQPIAPVTAPPLWQVLVIQLHWRTAAAGHADSPVADNAVLHWYVYGKPDEHGTAMLHYLGTGAVSVSTDSNGASVTIHNAELHRIEQHGNLKDPLVDFHINSQFNAVEDPVRLKQILDDLHAATADASPGTSG